MTIRSFGVLLAFLLATAAIGPTAAQESQPATGATAGQPAPPTAAPPPDTVVAIVNGTKVTRADVIASAQSLPAEYQSKIDAIFPALIDRLVDLTLLAEEGRKQNLQDDPEVKARIEQVTNQVIQEVVIRRHLQKEMTEDAIKVRYEKFIAEQPAQIEIRASHILVATEEEAKDIIKQLEGGADFAAIAKEKSTDPSAKQNGGDLGYFSAGDMVPEFSQAVFAMEKGESSKAPVKSQFGWHVIKVVDKRPKAPPSLEETHSHIEELLSSELLTAYLASLRTTAKVEKFNPDGTPITAAPATGGTEQPPPQPQQ
ncbi:MAG TPA: peptidylprolyl isomerase [Candidatus Angelobacter sp.]|nr:peptidylprolyl isomerase [Candidatus Angelobacter sp.]